ncbi:hypothetical protein FRC04_011338 [Tulasnella sp. 424]|nr:hypothetical protein FRC04_011338 [Tulasnella sp. 424]KAG8975494.1 hypothetical protein FRC05_005563 [Tulasnella sp. 425]
MGLFSGFRSSSGGGYLLGGGKRKKDYGAIDDEGHPVGGPDSPSLVPKLPSTLPIPRSSSPMATVSPRNHRFRAYDLEDVLEVDEEEAEELVDVPYSTLVRNYTLVPISSLLFLLGLIILFTTVWPITPPPTPDNPSPPPSSPQHPWWKPHPSYAGLLVGASAWIISYTLRIPIYTLSTCFHSFTNAFTVALSTILSIALEEGLRLGALVILGLKLDDPPASGSEEWDETWPRTGDAAFQKTFWVAVGFAIVEVGWSIAQGYEQLALYRDVLPPSPSYIHNWLSSSSILPPQSATESHHPGQESSDSPIPSDSSESESISHRYVHSALKKSISPSSTVRRGTSTVNSLYYPQTPNTRRPESALEAGLYGEALLDAEMRELINLQSRVELEMVYGVPPPNIPVFISVLQRIDSILLTVGLTLTISSVWLTQLAAASEPSPSPADFFSGGGAVLQPHRHTQLTSAEIQAALGRTFPTYLVLTLLHASLALMWTEALPRIGVHTASYAALLVSLGVFFAGLGWWGALS